MTAAAGRFTHLHVHSCYTLLGATPAVEELVEQAVIDGLADLALTDTHALYGAVAFTRACTAAGIRPIVGMATRTQSEGELVLLATGREGYRSLCALSSALQAAPDREAALLRGLSGATLRAHRQGLLCIAGGRRSELAQALGRGDTTAANRQVARLAGLFDDCLYLAVEIHTAADVALAREVAALGVRLGVAPVAVQPIYCMHAEDRARLGLLAAMDRNCTLDALAPDDLPDGGDADVTLHWLAPDAIQKRFQEFPEMVATAGEVAARCEPALPDGRPIWPVLDLPAETTPEAALAVQAQDGMMDRYGAPGNVAPAAVRTRLQAELDVICSQGFAPYFLLVADIVAFARSRQIPVSTRGSVANSLVAFCLGITTVDPIEHDLLFERFLNPARSNLPDIDLDFCSVRRDEVLHYVRRKYGEARVALLATVSTMRPKSALRETAKAYGADETLVKDLLKRLPDRWHPDPRRRVAGTPAEMLAGLSSPQARRIVEDAYAVLGMPHHLSIHPGGVVVTPGPLTDYFPVQWTPKGFLISQFAHDDMETLGLPKMDLLGIRALTVLADAAHLVHVHHDPQFRVEAIHDRDGKTGALLAAGDTVGVFQCDSNGARRTLRQLRAANVRDLAVANAFFKPGPATGGMADRFIRRYRGEEDADFLHPALAPILASTQGVLLFQEQILRVAVEIAGLSWEEADNLRRGMSKFEAGAMEAMAALFVAGCRRAAPIGPGLDAAQAQRLWEQVRAFAGYGFNQGHATAYADVSYRSAYMKAHWPAAFFAARLANYGGFHHPAIYIAEAKSWGIPVYPPHINRSRAAFTLVFLDAEADRHPYTGADVGGVDGTKRGKPTLWMGLEQVSNLRREAVRAIVHARGDGPYLGLEDLLRRLEGYGVQLQQKELAHLIQSGALDGLGPSRAALLHQAQARPKARPAILHAPQLAFDFGPDADDAATPPHDSVPPESPGQRLAWEMRILGFPVSVNPLQALAAGVEGDSLAAFMRRPAAGTRLVLAAYRLPGWTGGAGYFVSDGTAYCTAILPRHAVGLKTWQPVRLTGRWAQDEWGSGWFQVEQVTGLG